MTICVIGIDLAKQVFQLHGVDAADAEGICIAVNQPSMRFVPVNAIEQQDIQGIHRARELAVKQPTALSNQIRADCQRLGQMRGIGPLIATALVAGGQSISGVQEWSGTCRLAGSGTATTLYWGQGGVTRHQQARRLLPQDHADPWRSGDGLAL